MSKRLNNEQKKEIKAMFCSGYRITDIAKKFNRHHSSIHRIIGNIPDRPNIKLDFKKDLIDVAQLITELENTKKTIQILLDKISLHLSL